MVTGRARAGVEDAEKYLEGPAARLATITVAAGAEDYLRDRLVGAFRRGSDAEGAEFLRLEADDLSAEELAQALASVSLFGNQRRIWIREGSKVDRGCEEALLAWADGGGAGARVLVTTVRDVPDLKVLQSLATRGSSVSCDVGPAERRRWGERMLEEAGVRLPGGALDAILARAGNLLALAREVEKLALHADASGRVLPAVLEILATGRGAASVARWADGLIRRDQPAVAAESARLESEGEGGGSSLWAVAERALQALDPTPFGYDRRPTPAPGSGISPNRARALLDRVYRADRGLKRGEIPDADLRTYLEITTERSNDG